MVVLHTLQKLGPNVVSAFLVLVCTSRVLRLVFEYDLKILDLRGYILSLHILTHHRVP